MTGGDARCGTLQIVGQSSICEIDRFLSTTNIRGVSFWRAFGRDERIGVGLGIIAIGSVMKSNQIPDADCSQ